MYIKIFEEHKNYINSKNNIDNSKYYLSNLYKKNNSIPLTQNNFIKERIKLNKEYKNESYKIMSKFYESLYGNNSTFFNDLNNYFNNFQEKSISNNKGNDNNKKEEFNKNKVNKNNIKCFSHINIFYNRIKLCFESDYPSTVYTACDIFYMLYNKMMDNICYNPNFLSYIEELDEYIINFFIKPCNNDLIKLSELIIKNEVEELNSNLEKFYK